MHGTLDQQRAGSNPWTPERQAELLRLARAGLSSTEIARELHTSRNAIIGRLARTRIPLKNARGPKQDTRALQARVGELIKAGLTTKQIETQTGVRDYTIWRVARQLNLQLNTDRSSSYRFTPERARALRIMQIRNAQNNGQRIPLSISDIHGREEIPWSLLARRQKPVVPDVAPILDANIPLAQRKTLLELGAHDCRWPVGDPEKAGFFFCGAPAQHKSSYCAGHHYRAHDYEYEGARR